MINSGTVIYPMSLLGRQYAIHFTAHWYCHISGNILAVWIILKRTGPEVIKLFLCSTQLSIKFKMLISKKLK